MACELSKAHQENSEHYGVVLHFIHDEAQQYGGAIRIETEWDLKD